MSLCLVKQGIEGCLSCLYLMNWALYQKFRDHKKGEVQNYYTTDLFLLYFIILVNKCNTKFNLVEMYFYIIFTYRCGLCILSVNPSASLTISDNVFIDYCHRWWWQFLLGPKHFRRSRGWFWRPGKQRVFSWQSKAFTKDWCDGACFTVPAAALWKP